MAPWASRLVANTQAAFYKAVFTTAPESRQGAAVLVPFCKSYLHVSSFFLLMLLCVIITGTEGLCEADCLPLFAEQSCSE